MSDVISAVFGTISALHFNVLLLLGLAVFGGTFGGRIFQKLHIPQVVGYIAIGILIGQTGLKLIDLKTITALEPFNLFALGMIGFMIGGELKKEALRKYGKQLVTILLFEGFTSFVVVSVLVYFVGSFLFSDTRLVISIALLLGAISSATAPAATTDVLWEYKTRGPLTSIIFGVVAMDDALALFLFAIASSIAGVLMGTGEVSIRAVVLQPAYELIGGIGLGLGWGYILSVTVKKYIDTEKILAFSVGTILLVLGCAIALKADILLAAMALGTMIANYLPRKSKEVFNTIGTFTPPIYILFFVLFGAKLNVKSLSLPILVTVILYLVARTSGKAIGAYAGARLSGAAKTVQRYLPLCLLSQAGVAIGLSILVSQRFPNEVGATIVIVITTTTFIVQIIGPSLTKLGVKKAGEVGLNITEDDVMNQYNVGDVLEKNVELISEELPIAKILSAFGRGPDLYYPVIDSSRKLIGVITIESIKDSLGASEYSQFLLAHDIMETTSAIVSTTTSLVEAEERMKALGVEYLVATEADGKVAGLLESRRMRRMVSGKLFELQEKADLLHVA